MRAGRGQRIDSIDGVFVWRLVLVAGAHIARRDRVGANAIPPQFVCEGLDERDDAGLGGAVGGMVGRRCNAVDRGERDQRSTAALGDHVLCRGLKKVEHLGQVVVDCRVPQLNGEVLDLRPGCTTDDIDAHVDTAQCCDDVVDRPTDLRGVGHIGDDRDGITAPADNLAGNALRALLVDIDASHQGARLGQGQRREPAMARALRDVARTRHHSTLTG